MRQALSALILSLGLLTFPVTALADSDRPHSHKKFSDQKGLKHERAIHHHRPERAERRQHKQKLHRKLHRIKQHRAKKYHHFSGHNYNKWQARRHYFHTPHHNYHYRHGIKHRHHSHKRDHKHNNSDYLELLGIMLLLDEVLEDDYR